MGSDTPGEKPVILNGCLTYVKYLMISNDKDSVQDRVCSKFDCATIKAAYEALFKCVKPTEKFTYRGPTKGSDREKQVHAFNEVYKMLSNLDAQGISPVIACPSDALHTVLPVGGLPNQFLYEDRLRTLEKEVMRIKYLENSVSDIKKEVSSLKSSNKPSFPALPAALPRRFRSNSVISNASRGRSISAASSKRGRSEDDESGAVSSNEENEFQVPKNQRKKKLYQEKRLKVLEGQSRYSDMVKSGTPAKNKKRRDAVWGKSNSSDILSGAIPDIFLFNCSASSSEELVSDHLKRNAVNVTNVKLISHQNARKRSFKLSVASYSDFDKVLNPEGEILPRGVGARKYFHPKNNEWQPNSDGKDSQQNSAGVTTSQLQNFFTGLARSSSCTQLNTSQHASMSNSITNMSTSPPPTTDNE